MTGTSRNLNGVSETLLITLYLRAMESQRSDALIQDKKAVALVEQMSHEFARIRQFKLTEHEKLTMILRNREFDRYALDFLARCPDGAVVHVGCGLDSRFERVDNGQVEWYDLDLPKVIAMREELLGGDDERYHLLGCSVLEEAWLDSVNEDRSRPLLVLVEGVLMYFEEAEVRSLVLTLRNRFPGAELVFDAFSPLHNLMSNFRLSITNLSARFNWGLWHGEEIEAWGEGIRLLDDWGYLESNESRMADVQWMRFIPLANRAGRIYRFHLGAN